MRRKTALIATLAAGLLASACGKKDDDKKETPAPKTTEPVKQPEAPKELTGEDKAKMVQACWDAADAKDNDKLKGCYHADVVTTFPDSVPPMSAKGPDATLALFQPFMAAFPDIDHQLGLIAVTGDKVAVFGTLKGTNEGEFMGMPATGKPVAMWFAQVADLKDGKVVRDDHYFDGGTMMAQLGVSPNPMAPTAESIEPAAETMTVVGAADGEAEKANLELMKKSEELMKNKDWKAMIDMYADDAEFRFVAGNQPAQGKDAIAKGMQEWAGMHSALEVSTRDMWAAGDWVIAETTSKGTLAGNIPGTKVKTKGKSYESLYLEFFHLTDGKIDKHWIFSNSSKWAADLGLFDPSKMGAGK